MNNYYKYNRKRIFPLQQKKLCAQELWTQKRDDLLKLRLPKQLKEMIVQTAKEKKKSYADLTILLWVDYFSKTGRVQGKIKPPSEEEMKADVEYFLKNLSKEAL